MSFVDTTEFGDLDFRIGRCAECERDVLTYVSYGVEGGETVCCVHCDVPLVDELQSAPGAGLPDIGYGLLETQGCGNPDCGGGQCGRAMMKEAAADQQGAAGDDDGTP